MSVTDRCESIRVTLVVVVNTGVHDCMTRAGTGQDQGQRPKEQ